MQKSKEREYPIPFHNDVFFKYMLIGEGCGLCHAEKQDH